MKWFWLFLMLFQYFKASTDAYNNTSKRRTDVSLIQLKYPRLSSYIPLSHKYYQVVLYVLFGCLAY